MKKTKDTSKGITLIALVITIIVMLILVAVTITTAINGGLFKQAGKAVGETQNEINKEQTLANGQITVEDKTYASINDYINNNPIVDSSWEAILADANANPQKYRHEEQTTSTYIAIGTDGNPVNMDLWIDPIVHQDGTYNLRGEYINAGPGVGWIEKGPAYKGSFTDGKIEGYLPQYIYNTTLNEFKAVTIMQQTFLYCSSLTSAPVIPETVTDLNWTFGGCTRLTTAPVIPDNVTSMRQTFQTCTSLVSAPTIPNGVTDMTDTFMGCSSLKTAPVIPGSVVYLTGTFWRCGGLTGDLIINANPRYYTNALNEASVNEGCELLLSGTSEYLDEILGTSTSENIKLKSPQ